jgi:hypothetical protein
MMPVSRTSPSLVVRVKMGRASDGTFQTRTLPAGKVFRSVGFAYNASDALQIVRDIVSKLNAG